MANLMPTIAAARAARAHQQMLLVEEEKMTPYPREELDHDWEFKIVRASTAAFRKPAVFRRIVDEEARAGWVLVEKFDDSRIRFKRPIEARRGDEQLMASGVDPYRTQFGISGGAYSLAVALVTVLLTLGLVFGILASVR
jgi:hypothetical protein